MRIRIPTAKDDPDALEEIRESLCSIACVSKVKVNEALGTATIHYDHQCHEEFLKHLTSEAPEQTIALKPCPTLSDLSKVDEMLAKETEFLAGHSHAAQALLRVVDRLDEGVKRATGNTFDLKVIVPLVLAVGAFTELGVTAATPVWLTLGLFSFNHFIDLHAHHEKKPAETMENNGEPPGPVAPRKLTASN
ncbi:MAG: hypothetical protein JOY54_02995 [Acidobacteriaceae bacterium]|nr:hypothetical protein [Acidobacteriaceae bacterium]